MNARPLPARRARTVGRDQHGATLIEVLVSVVILLVALLGTAGLMARSSQSEMESYQRAQALTLLQDMVSRLNANRQAIACYADGVNITMAGAVVASPVTCAGGSAVQKATAAADLAAWGTQLNGSAETDGTQSVGAMIGALGCVEAVDVARQIYRVTVAWQGLAITNAPSLPCGQNRYGNDGYRRAVSVQVRIGVLS